MFNIKNNELVIDYKGLYSIEKFIIARKLMYWQVYLHKTVLSAEHTLMHLLKRAKHLIEKGVSIYSTPAFKPFLYEKEEINEKLFIQKKLLNPFALIDDYDIYNCIKNWLNTDDQVIQLLSETIINRKLLKIISVEKEELDVKLKELRLITRKKFNINHNDVQYLVFSIRTSNETYNFNDNEIKFLTKNNISIKLSDIKTEFNISTENSNIIKHYICCPKDCII